VSVAFRRDSDEEHLEPKFEIPIPRGPNLVTERGLVMIRARIVDLDALLLTLEGEDAIKAAKRDRRYWTTRAATAELAPLPKGDTVEFGCTVVIAFKGKTRRIAIVGDDEADPAHDRLSFSAPLSRAVMGAEVGERLPFAGQDEAIEVLEIIVDQPC
jgi:transcription elongation GreA/GreB family factor